MGEEPDRVATLSDVRKLITEDGEKTRKYVDQEGEKTRRYFDMVAEKMSAEFKVVAEKTVAIGEKVDHLIARNAIEHAAFVDALTDHEVRLRVLEATRVR